MKPQTQVQKNKDKFQAAKDRKLYKLEYEIDNMNNDDVVQELKKKALLVFGTAQERKDRLKKAHGSFLLLLGINVKGGDISIEPEVKEAPVVSQKKK